MADGIGGSVKRQLDKIISYGHDITNATEACHVLQNIMKSVKCLYISESDIHNFKKLTPDGLRAGTWNNAIASNNFCSTP